jgi:3-hydroxyisobutyrate dehydrogenase-like beta-hydroxyacid dehydrogenase
MTHPTPLTVGFVGLGNMGAHMARRLLAAGFEVQVLDLDDSAMERAVALGATRAADARALADAADVVCLSLPRPTDVESVVLGTNGLIEGSRMTTVIDLSTTGPRMARRVAEALAATGRQLLDAPVSGGPRGAEHGTMCIMAAGDAAVYARFRPLLETLGRPVHLGQEPGQGQTMKVINNTISASCMTASCEGLALGAKAGLDASAMVDVLNASTARNTHTEDKIPRCVLTGGFDFGFQLALLLKDVRLCLGVAEDLEVPMLLARTMQQLLAMQLAFGGERQDMTEIMRLLEGWGGVEVREQAGDAAVLIGEDAR